MRGNVDVRGRDYFESVSSVYAEGRSSVPPDVVAAIAELGRLENGTNVIEVGCGTGQLTGPLLHLGCHVTGVDLGASLINICSTRAPAEGRLRLIVAEFEEVDADQRCHAVVSSNAFHWIRRPAAYQRARSWLNDDGVLILHWSCPVLPKRLQVPLSDMLRARFAPARWDTARFMAGMAQAQVDGVFELMGSGLFGLPSMWTGLSEERQSLEQFALHVLSYQGVGPVDNGKASDLTRAIVELFSGMGLSWLEYPMYHYVVASTVRGLPG